MKVEIPVTLEEGKEYTLIIPSGCILGKSDALTTAPTFTLHFSTNKYEAPNVDLVLCDKQANADAQALYQQLLSSYGRTIIEQIKLLQDAHVAVLWRPYHEAKGNTGLYNGSGKAWFWWGTDGPEVFKKLWLDMYDRFQKAGLHNLIWVFTDSTDNLSLDWYPGNEYVDIVGADVYNKTIAKDCADVFQGLERAYPHKMITLSECGNVADLQSQWEAGAKWLWFMPWYGGGDTPHYTQEWWSKASNSKNVLMR